MPNLAAALKEEIRRLAKKEIKSSTEVMRRQSAQHRRDIAGMKRQVADLQRKVALLEKQVFTKRAAVAASSEDAEGIRFSAKGLVSRRKKLGFSAQEYATLIDVSAQTLYNWEQERSRPREAQLKKLAAIRGIGKKEALAMLEQLS